MLIPSVVLKQNQCLRWTSSQFALRCKAPVPFVSHHSAGFNSGLGYWAARKWFSNPTDLCQFLRRWRWRIATACPNRRRGRYLSYHYGCSQLHSEWYSCSPTRFYLGLQLHILANNGFFNLRTEWKLGGLLEKIQRYLSRSIGSRLEWCHQSEVFDQSQHKDSFSMKFCPSWTWMYLSQFSVNQNKYFSS